MTEPTVVFVGACDRCGHLEATWYGTLFEGNNTVYEVDCPACASTGWSVAEQISRRLQSGGIKSPLRSVKEGAVTASPIRRPA